MSKWPKKLPLLSPDQKKIRDDFMQHWLETVPKRFGIIEKFSNGFTANNGKTRGRVLDLGAGLGNHITHKNLSQVEYHAIEIRPNIARMLIKKFPRIHVQIGDCQKRLKYPDHYFDQVQAIHVLEHLPNLPAALGEITRVLKPGGEFCVVIPCEGGLLHNFARGFAGKKEFENRYGISYDWCIQSEHVNTAQEVIEELLARFRLIKSRYFPFFLPSINANLFIGLILVPKPHAP